jgi:hypothetical protein
VRGRNEKGRNEKGRNEKGRNVGVPIIRFTFELDESSSHSKSNDTENIICLNLFISIRTSLS